MYYNLSLFLLLSRSTYKYEIKTKEREIKELEEQLIDMKTETMKSAALWQEKVSCSAFESR